MCAQYTCKADAIPAFPDRLCFPGFFIFHPTKTGNHAEKWMPT
jgi:hypothetical protein